MKFLKLASASLALTLATQAHGAIISYGGYTHDTTANIVTGNDLEWLQWDRTVGESINSIQSQLNTLEGGDWRVASVADMAQLLNAFDFGMTFEPDENTSQLLNTGFSVGDPGTEADELFITMFGEHTIENCYSGLSSDCFTRTGAIYGHDDDQDGYYNWVAISDDEIWFGPSGLTEDGGNVITYGDVVLSNESAWSGVALVRDVSAVPVPAAVWLFGSGLIGLVGFARRKKA